MSEQVLMAIIQLMASIIGTEGIEPENKKTAQNILTKSLALVDRNISKVHASLVANIQLQ